VSTTATNTAVTAAAPPARMHRPKQRPRQRPPRQQINNSRDRRLPPSSVCRSNNPIYQPQQQQALKEKKIRPRIAGRTPTRNKTALSRSSGSGRTADTAIERHQRSSSLACWLIASSERNKAAAAIFWSDDSLRPPAATAAATSTSRPVEEESRWRRRSSRQQPKHAAASSSSSRRAPFVPHQQQQVRTNSQMRTYSFPDDAAPVIGMTLVFAATNVLLNVALSCLEAAVDQTEDGGAAVLVASVKWASLNGYLVALGMREQLRAPKRRQHTQQLRDNTAASDQRTRRQKSKFTHRKKIGINLKKKTCHS
jgi:hypothetical protein